MNKQIGVITEQNDLGLGFDPLSKKEQKVYNESVNKTTKESSDKKDKK